MHVAGRVRLTERMTARSTRCPHSRSPRTPVAHVLVGNGRAVCGHGQAPGSAFIHLRDVPEPGATGRPSLLKNRAGGNGGG